jgi:hypothetical protein
MRFSRQKCPRPRIRLDLEACRCWDAGPTGFLAVARTKYCRSRPEAVRSCSLGILITDVADVLVLKSRLETQQKAVFEIIAPKVGGAPVPDGSWMAGIPHSMTRYLGRLRRRHFRTLEGRPRAKPPSRHLTHCKYIGKAHDAMPRCKRLALLAISMKGRSNSDTRPPSIFRARYG